MKIRLCSAFLALVILMTLSACSTGEPSPKALEDGTLPIDQFQSEDGTFQYAELPVGITKEETAKRLGVEDLGPVIAGVGDVTTYSPETKVTYEGHEMLIRLEFQGDELTLMEFQFLSHEEETLNPIKEELIERLFELYGIYSQKQSEHPPYHFESTNWDTHLDGDLTRLSVDFYRVEQEGSTGANLSIGVGKMVYANETE